MNKSTATIGTDPGASKDLAGHLLFWTRFGISAGDAELASENARRLVTATRPFDPFADAAIHDTCDAYCKAGHSVDCDVRRSDLAATVCPIHPTENSPCPSCAAAYRQHIALTATKNASAVALAASRDMVPRPARRRPLNPANSILTPAEEEQLSKRIVIGTGATFIGWSDRAAYHVVAISASRRTLTLARATAKLDPTWKPIVAPGGFVGHCLNNNEQRWLIEENPNGDRVTVRLHKNGQWRAANGNRYSIGEAREFHDYNF